MWACRLFGAEALERIVYALPDSSWLDWKCLARRFVQYGLDRNFNRHFRAGQSMSTLVFSTLDRHGLRDGARVAVTLRPPDELKLIYWPATPATKGDQRLEYDLHLDEAMPTFQRFLNHLWETSMSDPLPSDMRSPQHPFNAPVLSAAKTKAEQGVAHQPA
jgi:hypothetical protein